MVADLREDLGDLVARDLAGELGARARFVATDVSKKESVQALVDATVSEFGRVDILVNNAQTFTELVPLEEKTDAMMAASLDSGAWATFWSMQAVFPHMREQHYGRIVNFCSLNMVTGAWYSVDYNAAKGAIQALTRSATANGGRTGSP